MKITNPLNQTLKHSLNSHIRQTLNTCTGNNVVDCGVYGRLIQFCSDSFLLRQAKQLHARIVLSSIIPSNYLASKLISLYSKSNLLHEAHQVFDRIPQPNIFSWNALLIGYTLQDRFDDTIKLFSLLLSLQDPTLRPDGFTISCVLKALSSVSVSSFGGSRLAKGVHCFVLRHGFESDIFVINALVTLYSRCEEVDSARMVFDRMLERDVVSWNSMIAGYSQCGCYDECKGLYREMLGSDRIRPDRMTAVSVLQACGQSRDLLFGMEVHRFVVDNGIELDISLCNALIGFYAKCGSLDYARELFDEVEEKDEVTYGSIISGYMAHGYVDKAMDIFRGMQRPALSVWNAIISGLVQNNQHEQVLDLFREMQAFGVRPNSVTLSSVLPTCAHLSNLKGGKEVHAYAVKKSYDRNIYVGTAIIDIYAKTGFLCGARHVFDKAKNRSLIIWTAMISAYATHGDAYMALSLFNEMLDGGIQPDPVTFTAVLSSCAHTGLVDEAWKIFNAMLPDYGVEPSVEQYACVVGALSRAGKLSEAANFIRKMPLEPSAKVWGALLNGASVAGDVELGKFACDHLFEIEPENTGNYIIMANLYSQAGRWEEADRVREQLKNVGVKKIAGSSWIETKQGHRSFIATDMSGERSEEMHEVLEGLLGMMREQGYVLREELDEENLCI